MLGCPSGRSRLLFTLCGLPSFRVLPGSVVVLWFRGPDTMPFHPLFSLSLPFSLCFLLFLLNANPSTKACDLLWWLSNPLPPDTTQTHKIEMNLKGRGFGFYNIV